MKKRKRVVTLITIIVIGVIFVTFYYMNKAHVYNKTLTAANKAVVTEEYDKAITLYEEALNYKKDPEVNKNIALVNLLIKSKATYAVAIKQTTNKNYLGAIDNFKKVDKQDTKRYSIAQSKISECTKLYVEDNIKRAKDYLISGKFDEANKVLDNIFKLEVNNANADKVKAYIKKAIQKQKDEAAEAKADAAKKITTYNQALQIVINSNDFKGAVKGLTKKTDMLYVNSDNITGVSLSPDGYSGHLGEAWIPVTGYSSDEGWSIFNDRKAFSITLGY
jgi:tetratricopeptide (TPR) repeat protein